MWGKGKANVGEPSRASTDYFGPPWIAVCTGGSAGGEGHWVSGVRSGVHGGGVR